MLECQHKTTKAANNSSVVVKIDNNGLAILASLNGKLYGLNAAGLFHVVLFLFDLDTLHNKPERDILISPIFSKGTLCIEPIFFSVDTLPTVAIAIITLNFPFIACLANVCHDVSPITCCVPMFVI